MLDGMISKPGFISNLNDGLINGVLTKHECSSFMYLEIHDFLF